MNNKINDMLKEKVISLTQRCKDRQTNMFVALNIKANNESEKIQELLKIAMGTHSNNTKEVQSICSDDMMNEVFSIATTIVQDEEKRVQVSLNLGNMQNSE